jgi:hypothetical protein
MIEILTSMESCDDDNDCERSNGGLWSKFDYVYWNCKSVKLSDILMSRKWQDPVHIKGQSYMQVDTFTAPGC